MRSEIEALRSCATALGELLPDGHPYQCIVEQARRLIDRADHTSQQQRIAEALRDLMGALPTGTKMAALAFRPAVDGQAAGTVSAILMSLDSKDLHCALRMIERASIATSHLVCIDNGEEVATEKQ